MFRVNNNENVTIKKNVIYKCFWSAARHKRENVFLVHFFEFKST